MEWHKIYKIHKKIWIQNVENFIHLYKYCNRFFFFLFLAFHLFFCTKTYSKDINPTYDSSVSNHNKNQSPQLRHWFKLVFPPSHHVGSNLGRHKMLQFFNPLKYVGNKRERRVKSEKDILFVCFSTLDWIKLNKNNNFSNDVLDMYRVNFALWMIDGFDTWFTIILTLINKLFKLFRK